MNKAVFLDRDGVINREIGDYVFTLSEFEINEGVIESLKRLKELDYLTIIISNQGGIAKGRYTIDDVENIHACFKRDLEKHGAEITEIYYCPHHNDYGTCLCRKPKSILFEKAIARFDIDPEKSIMIGDKERDIVSGEKAGVKGILIEANLDIRNVLKEYIPEF